MTPRRALRILELRSLRGKGGGPEKTILHGASRAAWSRFAVTVCYIRDARDLSFDVGAEAGRLALDYVELIERSALDVRLWPGLRRVVRERAIDIVHAHDYKTDLLALLLARREGIIPLATAHGWTGQSLRERRLYYPLDKRVLRSFPMVIAVSGEIGSELLGAGVRPDRCRVVLNGIDHRALRRDRACEQRVRTELGLTADELVVGAVGRLESQKRFDLLMRACAVLRERRPTLRLLVAGDGSLRAELERLAARLLPGGACRLLGHCPDVVSLHHAFDVFVQSSDYEGTSNAVLEAMALETPIVATAAGGTVEIVEPEVHGLVVPPGDVLGLTQGIDRTLSDKHAAAARVVRARSRVATQLSFDARLTAVESIYEELATRYRTGAVTLRAEKCA